MYCTPAEVRQVATQMTTGAKTSGSPTAILDVDLVDLIERASRFFDLEVGCEPGYFDPALYPVWESSHVYAVGDIITPTTPNAHKYRVTTAGTSGTTEPTFPTSSGGTVTNGGVTFTENGADVVATARTFYGDGTSRLRVDPYVPGTLSTTITVPTGYTALDFIERGGYLVQAADPSSGVVAVFTNRGEFSGGWASGVPVTITAKWGYESTPADVKMAVIEMVINIFRETDPASLKLVSIDNQPLREAIPPRVKEVARRYRLQTAKAVFV